MKTILVEIAKVPQGYWEGTVAGLGAEGVRFSSPEVQPVRFVGPTRILDRTVTDHDAAGTSS